MATMFQSKCTK